MSEQKKQLLKQARWMEPIGQFLVLLGAGLQFFYLEPAKSSLAKVEIDRVRSLLGDVDFKITRIMEVGSKKCHWMKCNAIMQLRR